MNDLNYLHNMIYKYIYNNSKMEKTLSGNNLADVVNWLKDGYFVCLHNSFTPLHILNADLWSASLNVLR